MARNVAAAVAFVGIALSGLYAQKSKPDLQELKDQVGKLQGEMKALKQASQQTSELTELNSGSWKLKPRSWRPSGAGSPR